MEEILRIALAQINVTVGDLKGNVEKILDFTMQAQRLKANIITFPELAICGYPPEDLLLKKYFVTDNIKAVHSLAERISDIVVIVGFVDRDKEGNLYSAAGVIHKGKLKGIAHKIELPNYGVFDEKRYFQPGNSPFVFALGRAVLGVNICEDIWMKGGVAKYQAGQGARLLINISASPYHAGKGTLREKMLKERAEETNAYICYNNLVGGQDELVFDGTSMILDAKGKKIVTGKQFEEDLIFADLPIRVNNKSKARVECKYYIKLDKFKDTKKPDLPKRYCKKLDRINEIYNALVLGTRDYVRKNGFKKAIIGLSGGIDSSLTAVIACDAIGKENVIGVSMPSRYSSKETQSDAKLVAHNLGIRLIVVPIDAIFKIYLLLFEKEFFGLPPDMTEENLQARIRGNILMALSNKFGWLVLTTGNKSETSVGYCTLYGDMAGGFAVIKDVLKELVYKLARFRNEKEDRRLIPDSIFKREPSAELKMNQMDKDTLPPYPILDVILKEYVEEDKGFEEIVSSTKLNPEIVKEVIQMVDRNEYKRRQAPPGIKITPKAFGKDRRLPIVNKYKEY
jgi:NAD+ synthase (glutamine-hydrolysing)